MTTLICGSNGFIAGMLSMNLKQLNRPHLLLGRAPNSGTEFELVAVAAAKDSINKTIAVGDLNFLSTTIANFEITHLVNLAGKTTKSDDGPSARQLIASNVLFATELAILCKKSGVKNYIFTSTYSTSIGEKKYNPQTLYSAAKKAAEDILIYFAHNNDFKLTILNLYDVYGPSSPHEKIVNSLIKSLLNGDRFQMSQGFQEACPIHIDDVTSAIIASIDNMQKENYAHFDIYGPNVVRIKDLPGIIALALNKTWGEDQLSFSLPTRKREIKKFEPQFGLPSFWKPCINLTSGIQSFIDRP